MTWICYLIGGPDDGKTMRRRRADPVIETIHERHPVRYLDADDPEAANPFGVPNTTWHRYDLVVADRYGQRAAYRYRPPKDQP